LNERCRIEFEYKENLDEFPVNNSFDQQELISKFTQFFDPAPIEENTTVYHHRKPPGKQKTFKINPLIRRKMCFTAKNREAILSSMKLIEN
jgi:hypothetical protein